MTELIWDAPGTRRFDTGISKGVLFTPNNDPDSGYVSNGVAWNGITAVDENTTRDVKTAFIDGIQYLNYQVPGNYSAVLKAFTYPKEFEYFNGIVPWNGYGSYPGVTLYDQPAKPFHLSYQTKIGNDTDPDAGYLIHVIFNVFAQLSERNYESVTDEMDPIEFSWDLTAMPYSPITDLIVHGSDNPSKYFRPTAHVVFDSTVLGSDIFRIERVVYGADPDSEYPDDPGQDPGITTMQNLINLYDED